MIRKRHSSLLILFVIISILATGCVENNLNSQIESKSEKGSISSESITDKKTEENGKPDPYLRIRDNNIIVVYRYSEGALRGANVSAIIDNKGASGNIEVVLKVKNNETDKQNFYLESGKEKEISFFMPLTEYGQITATISIPGTTRSLDYMVNFPSPTPYIPPTPVTINKPYIPANQPNIPTGIPGR